MTASDQERKRGLRKIPYRFVFLFALIFAAVLLDRMGVLDWRHMVRTGEIHAHTWWFPPPSSFSKCVSTPSPSPDPY
jgi:hypothetical protein